MQLRPKKRNKTDGPCWESNPGHLQFPPDSNEPSQSKYRTSRLQGHGKEFRGYRPSRCVLGIVVDDDLVCPQILVNIVHTIARYCTYSSTRAGLFPESPAAVADSQTCDASSAWLDNVAVAARTEASVDGTVVAATATFVSEVPVSLSITTSFNVSPVARPLEPPMPGTNFVHQNAILSPLSSTRCFNTNKTTSPKKTRAEMMSTRSSQSVFSSAVTSCFEVPMRRLSVSCVCEADWRLVVEDSVDGGIS